MKFSAIILAAGQSKRFGPANKLLSPYRGTRLIDHCINTVLASNFEDRILVSGHECLKIEPIVKNLPIRTVHNQNFANGMGASLAVGVQALKADCDAFMVFLADMPEIPPSLVGELQSAYIKNAGRHSIIRPTYKGQPGHPVLFSSENISELADLKGDQGAGRFISQRPDKTLDLTCAIAGSVYDIDK